MVLSKSDFYQLIALGANVSSSGRPLAHMLHMAVTELVQNDVSIRAVSRFFQTPCFPAGAGPDYVNAVICTASDARPAELIGTLHKIEAEFGRKRLQRWGARTLDLDLLASGTDVVPDIETYRHWHDLSPDLQAKAVPDRLILPHPRMQDRGFVLVPLCDIAPDWRHPVLGKTARQMLAALPAQDISEIRPV